MGRGETVRLFTDEIRCPVWVHDLSAALLELVGLRVCGPINLAGPQPLTRWDFAMKMLAALGVTPGPNVTRSTVKESGLARARNLTLVSARAAHLLHSQLRPVDEVLRAEHMA
jgi:dTDP-4-dehydrorhamnose reductase